MDSVTDYKSLKFKYVVTWHKRLRTDNWPMLSRFGDITSRKSVEQNVDLN